MSSSEATLGPGQGASKIRSPTQLHHFSFRFFTTIMFLFHTFMVKGSVIPHSCSISSNYEVLDSMSAKQKLGAQPLQAVDPGKKLSRWKTIFLLITNTIGIGILSLPLALRSLGLIPGIITIVGLGLTATYTAYILGQFYQCYPAVMNIVDCCQVVGGRPLA